MSLIIESQVKNSGESLSPTTQLTSHETAYDFLHTLHPQDGCHYLLALHPDTHEPKRALIPVDTLIQSCGDQVQAFLTTYAEWNLHVGVAPRDASGKSTTEHCLALWALWIDLDFKDLPENPARARLEAFPFPPSIIIHSGGGLHVYWLLDKPCSLQNGGAARARAVLRTLALELSGDLGAAKPAQTLRLPGTRNHKYQPPRPVTFEKFSPHHYHDLETILSVLPTLEVHDDGDKPPVSHSIGVAHRQQLAKAWLKTQPPAIAGQHGDTRTFSICAAVTRGFDLEDSDAALHALHEWNNSCQPPWSDADLRQKIQRGFKYGDERIGGRVIQKASAVELIQASKVQIVKLDWLWSARLARGAVTLVEGGPEKGKSTILVDLAARISRGASLPGDQETHEPGNVVMLIAEDDLEATVVPRLIAAGADLSRVFFLGSTKDDRGQIVPFHLSDDCERLRAKCVEVSAVFVVVDPLVSYMGSRTGRQINTGNDLEVRKALGPLKGLAEHVRAPVAAVRHYKKSPGVNALEAGGGSVGFAGLVRVMLAALPDPDDETETTFLFAVAKNNLVPRDLRPALRYEIVPSAYDKDIGRIAWGQTVDRSANDILQALANQDTSGQVTKAIDFVKTFLANGQWFMTKEVMSAGKEQEDLSEPAIRRARTKLPIVVERREIAKGHWAWGWRLTSSTGIHGFQGEAAVNVSEIAGGTSPFETLL